MVKEKSMEPAFQEGDYVLVNRWARKFSPGDIVVVRDPRNPEREMLKRIAEVSERGYVVLGDNPGVSTDSRMFGPIVRSAIIGRALVHIGP